MSTGDRSAGIARVDVGAVSFGGLGWRLWQQVAQQVPATALRPFFATTQWAVASATRAIGIATRM